MLLSYRFLTGSCLLFLALLALCAGHVVAAGSGSWEVHSRADGLTVQFPSRPRAGKATLLDLVWQASGAVSVPRNSAPSRVLTGAAWQQNRQPLQLPAVFPGIDVAIHGEQGVPEFDFLVAPGANPDAIAYRFPAARSVAILPSGALLVVRDGDSFTQRPPRAWQTIGYQRHPVPVAFRLGPSGEVGFRLGAYRQDHTLVIDPTVELATYLGKEGDSTVLPRQIAVSPNGDVFVLAHGAAGSLPSIGTAHRPFPDLPENMVLLRFRGDTSQLISRTSLPLDVYDDPNFPLLLAVDDAGSPWVAIQARSTTIPALNPPIGSVTPTPGWGSRKALLLRLTADASAVTYSAYVGCTGDLVLQSLDAGKANRLVLGSLSTCSNFPITAGAYGSGAAPFTGYRAILLALNASTGSVAYSTAAFSFGLSLNTSVLARVDSAGRTVLAINTTTDGLPVTPGALYATRRGSQGAYLAALSSSGAQLEFATYFGADNWSTVGSAVIGPADSIYLSGQASGVLPLTPGAFDASNNVHADRRYVTRIRKDGAALESSAIIYSSSSSGAGNAYMGVMPNGDAVFATRMLPQSAPLSADSFTGLPLFHTWNDAYLARLSADGTILRFSSGFPSLSGLLPSGVAVSASGRLFVTGLASRNALPRTPNALASYPDSALAESARPGFLLAVDLLSPTICSFSVQPTPDPLGSARDPGTLAVTAPPGCPWVARTLDSETLEFNGFPAGVGNGSASFVTRPNLTLSPRSFPLSLGKGTVPLTQSAGQCSFFELDPPSIAASPAQLWQTLYVRTPTGCSWTASNNSLWFVNADSSPGSPFFEQIYNSGTSFYLAVFPNAFDARSGSVTLGPKTFSVTQTGAGCTASVAPASLSFPASGGSSTLNLQTVGTNCTWFGVGGPGVTFPTGRTGTNSASLPVEFSANPSNFARESFILLANKRIPITQPAGQCTPSFPSAVVEAPQVGGLLRIPFTATGNACAWNVAVNQPWLRVAYGSGNGTGFVELQVDPNPALTVRQATVTNLGASTTIRQLGTNTAQLVLSGPTGFWVKINGVKEVDPPPRSYPLGTTVTLEPQELQLMGTDVLFQTLGWEDLAQRNRSIVLNTSSTRLILRTQRLFRLAQEKVSGGTLDLSLAGLPSPYPEFYGQDPGFHTLVWEARPKPDPGYRFVGWLLRDLRTYWASDFRWFADTAGPFLRPRFEPVTTPSTPYFMPASLELTTYPVGDEIATMVEFRTPGGGSAALQPESCNPNFAAVRLLSFDPISGGYRLRIGMNHESLLMAGKTTVDCSISVRMNASGAVYSMPLKIRVEGVPAATAPPPANAVAAVTNAASFVAAPLAPGGLFTLFGQGMATATAEASSLPLPQLLANVQVRLYSEVDFATRMADLLYISPTQINFHVPADLPPGKARIRLVRNGTQLSDIETQVASASPGVFRVDVGGGQFAPAGYGTLVSGSSQFPRSIYACPAGQGCSLVPISMGGASDQLYLTLYGTGLRGLRPQDLAISANGVTLPVEYLGAHSYFVGLDQINVRVPASLRNAGTVPLELRVGTLTVDGGRLRF